MTDLDRLIHAFYTTATETGWTDFRSRALQMLCEVLGMHAAAWLTASASQAPGEFCQYPEDAGLGSQQLAALRSKLRTREQVYRPLCPELSSTPGAAETGYVFHYAHRGGALSSLVLLRRPQDAAGPERTDDWQRAIGHMVEAGSLALNQFVLRDEWLEALGRPSRGAAALMDASATLYAASPRFRSILAAEFQLPEDFQRLPLTLPPAVISNGGNLDLGSLRCRVTRHGNLYQVHVRPPAVLDMLSEREQQVARALGTGKTFKGVAREHGLAVSTVANHVSRIYKKLGIYRREELLQLLRKP
jgi:DNA-binding CsgD family transcriptional regulator